MLNTIQTSRLIVRKFTLEDADFLLELLNDHDFIRFIGDKAVRNVEQAKDHIVSNIFNMYKQHDMGLMVVESIESGQPLGGCGLLQRDNLPVPDIGYAFLPCARGQGYAFEAASAVMQCAREQMGSQAIAALVSPDNQASIKLLEKLGLLFDQQLTSDFDQPNTHVYCTQS